MQKIKWNGIVFLAYVTYCLLFSALFWCGKCSGFLVACLWIAAGVNTVSQILAVILAAIKGQEYKLRWLILGMILLPLTIALTTALGV